MVLKDDLIDGVSIIEYLNDLVKLEEIGVYCCEVIDRRDNLASSTFESLHSVKLEAIPQFNKINLPDNCYTFTNNNFYYLIMDDGKVYIDKDDDDFHIGNVDRDKMVMVNIDMPVHLIQKEYFVKTQDNLEIEI